MQQLSLDKTFSVLFFHSSRNDIFFNINLVIFFLFPLLLQKKKNKKKWKKKKKKKKQIAQLIACNYKSPPCHY